MAIIVTHTKVSTVPDSTDTSLVRPSDWNATHTLSGLGTAAELNAGVANGVATLDSAGKVPLTELPAAVLGALSYQGTWNASTNTPTLASGVGTKGYYYVVDTAGSTNLDGITDWKIGDWAVYNGTAWQKIDNTDSVTSVNGQTGAVVLTTTNVAEGTNEYFTTARARASVSAGTAITYDSGTGVITNALPDQTVVLTAGAGISTSGTYPNFTIANTSPSLGGDVVGPVSATDNAIARFDATTGKLLQNSVVIIDDTGSVTGVNALTAQSLTVNNNATLGSSNTDTLEVNSRITTDLEPNANNSKDIGTNGRNWRDGFFGRDLQTVNLSSTGNTTLGDAAADTVTINGTPTINAPTVITTNSATTALRITQTGTGNALLVEDSANPDATPFAVRNDGMVMVGGTPVVGIASSNPQLQVTGYGDGTIGTNAISMAFNAFLPNGLGNAINFNRSNGATVGTNTIVANGDQLGLIRWGGADGTNYIRAAEIIAAVDGTPGTNDMPGRLVFSTTADGASSPTERMRIDNAGRVGIGSTSLTGYSLRVGLPITGSVNAISVMDTPTVSSDVTSSATVYQSQPSTQATSFTLGSLYHFRAFQGTFGAGSAVTNQYGYIADSTITGATNNYGFYGNIASGTGRWNFYAAGTAANFLAGGVIINNNLGVGAAGSPSYGTSGQVLTSAGAGTVPTWSTPVSSNITAQGLYENANTIFTNYTIGSGNNAISAGPITIASGVTVTVPSGSVWAIV
jgi:hypothetical protein